MPSTAMNQEPEQKLPPPVHLLVRLELPDRAAREFSYDFRQNIISLGRDPSNDIQVPLTTVSRRHARIFYEMGDYFLEDLGSTHGTNHNGRRLGKGEKKLLRDSDNVSIMSFSITFKTTAGTLLDRQPGEKTEQLARRMVQEVLSTLGGSKMDPPALRVMNGPDEGQRLEIAEEQAEITIGRSPECDLPLNDQNISRRHCLIKRHWNGFTAQDLGSKNGVLVNSLKIEGAQNIKDGDEIQIGGIKLIFIDPPSRLLDQFGGLNGETMDGRGAGGDPAVTAGAEPAEDPAHDPEHDGGGYDQGHEDPSPEADVDPVHAGAPPYDGDGLGDDALDPALVEVNAEIAQVTRKGLGWEFLILVLGAAFLLGAIGLIVFLML